MMSMPPLVKLSEIVDGLETVGEETRTFLDTQTGKVIFLMDDHLRAAENEEDEDPTARGEWERESIEQAKAVLAEDGARFLPLPDRFEINEWEMMRDFATGLENQDQAEVLSNAIHGRGAFRYFKDRVHEFGLADAWYKFRQEQYRKVALDWCEAKSIEFDPDA
jgi:hypothetical protein